MSSPPPPVPPASVHTALQDAAVAIAAAGGSVDAALVSLGPPPSSSSQLMQVLRYLQTKSYEGFFLGVVFLVVALIDQSGKFVETISDGVTRIPVTVALTGILGGYVYVTSINKSSFVARTGAAWLDLVQQFFTLSTGAFLPVKAGLCARLLFHPGAIGKLDIAVDLQTFAWLVGAAFFVGGFWTLKDHPITPAVRKIANVTVYVAFLLLLGLLATHTGGEDLKDGIPHMVRKAFAGS